MHDRSADVRYRAPGHPWTTLFFVAVCCVVILLAAARFQNHTFRMIAYCILPETFNLY